MKKWIALFLALVMLFGAVSPGGLVYAKTDNGNNTILETEKQVDEKEKNKDQVKGALDPRENQEQDSFSLPESSLVPVAAKGKALLPAPASAIWLDGTNGDDGKDGSEGNPVKTFAKAMEIINDGGTLNVLSLAETNITVNKKVTLKFLNDVTMRGTGTAITLKGGAHLCVAEGKTLNINGYNKGILVEKEAEINDGNYVFKFPKNGYAFDTSGNIVGTSKDKLKMDITNGYFMFHSKDNELRNATINQRYDDDKWQLYEWNGFKAFDSEINLYKLPVYFKGPLYLDNTRFVIDGTGVNYQTGAYFENSWEVGAFHFTNKSVFEVKNFDTHWRGKGITFGYDNKLLVDKGAKVIVKNNKNGGLNANQGIATFNGGYLEGDGHSGSLFGAQDKENTKIVFGADSVVNTPMAKQSDNGLGQSGTNYIVLGGSHKVFYDPSYHNGLAIPVNGDENGNEKLTLFKLTDSSVEKLNPINKLGQAYKYSVKNASDDGNKYVWTPAAKVTFKLNNGNASFANGSKENKVQQTIRGYKLDDVAGNESLKDPKDAKGVKFLGWFYKTNTGEEKPFNRDNALTGDLDVYAKWEAKSIVYHNGDGIDYIVPIDKDAQEAKALSFDDVVKDLASFNVEGKSFDKWTANPDGTGAAYAAGQSIAFTPGTTQVDLYAHYVDAAYKIAFSANGGTFSDDSIFKTRTDLFKLEKDVNGGDVAVLKKTAKYDQKLSDVLTALNFDKKNLKPDASAKKPGFVPESTDNWNTSPRGGSDTALRFDDFYFFGIPVPGKDPAITQDTTYYMTWKDDPTVETISSNENLGADIWGQDRASSPKVQVVTPGQAFSLTGEIDAASIKGKMQGIETVFNKHTDAEFSSIALSNVSSTFKATLTMPDDVIIPENPTVTAKGLGKCFDLGKAEVKGQKVTIPFTLKPGMTDYKILKDAVVSTGQVSEDRTNNSLISVQIDGLKLKDTVADGQKVTITGDVGGSFSALARDNATLKRFSFTWKGKQTPEGKDEAATSEGIQYTLMMSKPTVFNLPGDLLVKKGQEGYDTTHLAVYPIDENDTLTFKGQLDISPIKKQINFLADGQGSTTNIALEQVKSSFIAKIEIPQGLEIPNSVQATLTENDLFKVTDVSKAGNVITVKMDLKKSYTQFDDLLKDVNAAGGDGSILNVEIPGIIVKDDTSGKEFVAKGQVEGSFYGVAKKEETSRVFNFTWKAQQRPDGKDVRQGQEDNNTIQLTLALPEKFDLPGDILIGDDTEHDALHKVKPGELLEFTGRLDVTSIKDKINLLKSSYGQDTSKIKTDNVKSTFVAKLEIPEGLEIPDVPTATLTNNDLFEIKNGDVSKDGNQIVVKMTLKKDYSKFDDLWRDVNAVPATLDLKVPGIKVKDNLVDGTKKTVLGHVEGKFEGTATSDSGKMQNYHFKWIGKQTPDGRDFILKGMDSESIQYTVVVNRESKPTPEPDHSKPTSPTVWFLGFPEETNQGKLNLDDHYAYMKGYPDKTFGPDRNMTRSEVAMMFARLLKDRPEANKVYTMSYKDVSKNSWYAYAVSYLSEKNLIMGYPDGTFRPDNAISRAEFAAIAARFDKLGVGSDLKFNDVGKNYWAYSVIASAAEKGWVSGYPDGSFKPENKITRAEVVSTTNRMLNRYADLYYAKVHKDDLAPMLEMDEKHGADGPVVEAMNGHDYQRKADGKNELWMQLNYKRFTFPLAPSGIAQ